MAELNSNKRESKSPKKRSGLSLQNEEDASGPSKKSKTENETKMKLKRRKKELADEPSDFQREIVQLPYDAFVEQTNIRQIVTREYCFVHSDATTIPEDKLNESVAFYYERRIHVKDWYKCGLKNLKFTKCDCKRNIKMKDKKVQVEIIQHIDEETQCSLVCKNCEFQCDLGQLDANGNYSNAVTTGKQTELGSTKIKDNAYTTTCHQSIPPRDLHKDDLSSTANNLTGHSVAEKLKLLPNFDSPDSLRPNTDLDSNRLRKRKQKTNKSVFDDKTVCVKIERGGLSKECSGYSDVIAIPDVPEKEPIVIDDEVNTESLFRTMLKSHGDSSQTLIESNFLTQSSENSLEIVNLENNSAQALDKLTELSIDGENQSKVKTLIPISNKGSLNLTVATAKKKSPSTRMKSSIIENTSTPDMFQTPPRDKRVIEKTTVDLSGSPPILKYPTLSSLSRETKKNVPVRQVAVKSSRARSDPRKKEQCVSLDKTVVPKYEYRSLQFVQNKKKES